VYYVGGHKVTYNVPPRGFNPLTATRRQLREYNLPAWRLLGGRRAWDRIMRPVRFTAPPLSLIEAPQKFAPNCHGACWAGYVDTGHSNYNAVSANFVEPHISSAVCSNPLAEGTWVGLGGFHTGNLGQDGTAYGTGHPHGAWWEVLPSGPVYSSWTGSAGDNISASTAWNTSSNKYDFAVIDGSHILSPSEQGGGYDGTSAEFITEAPGGDNLENFGSIPFTSAYSYYGSSSAHGVGQLPHVRQLMTNSNTGHTMAEPGPISGANSQNFTMNQRNCD